MGYPVEVFDDPAGQQRNLTPGAPVLSPAESAGSERLVQETSQRDTDRRSSMTTSMGYPVEQWEDPDDLPGFVDSAEMTFAKKLLGPQLGNQKASQVDTAAPKQHCSRSTKQRVSITTSMGYPVEEWDNAEDEPSLPQRG